jgi:predicted HTH transcriptional regulator
MSQNQVKALISSSRGIPFEKQIAKENLTSDEVLQLLNYQKLFELLDKNVPLAPDTILNKMKEHDFCQFQAGKWQITNLGAILFANDVNIFQELYGKSVIVRKYVGTNNREMEFEQLGKYGYAVGFEGLVDFIMMHTKSGEKRGSGIDYAIEAIEKQGLPPVKFTRSEQHTRIFLFPLKPLSEMTKEEKVMACYQHACLMYEDNKKINNQSIRGRFGIERRNASIATRIISETVNSGLIKISNPENESKKYATYIPFYG